MSFTPPLPPPLPAWPPFPDDDHSSLSGFMRRPPQPSHQPPLPPPPPPVPAMPSFTRSHSDIVPSFRSLSVIRNCDDNLRRMNTSVPPPGFDLPPPQPTSQHHPQQEHQQHLHAFDRNELNLGSSASQWGTASTSFSAHTLTSSIPSTAGSINATSSTTSSSQWGLSPAEMERKAVAMLVDKTFGTDTKVNGALVDWLENPVSRWHLASCFLNLRRDAIAFRDGASFKSDFEMLIARLAAHFMGGDMAASMAYDASMDKKLTAFFLHRVAMVKGDEYFVKRFVWACDGVRVIGDSASRTGNLGLSDDEVRDLCACVRSLATALPPIARQLEVAKRMGQNLITESIGSLTVSASTSRSTTPTTSPIVSPTLSAKKDVNKEAGAGSSWVTVVTTAPANSNKPAAVAQPTRETDDSLHFFDEAPELDGMKRVQVFRLKRHCTLLPKANLCPVEVSSAADHSPHSCQYSHSLLELMTYSPLYKLFVCNDDDHYGDHAHERGDCAFLHVDVGFKTDWMDDFARGKRSYCLSGSKCANKSCLKSHSFAEMCWYNPWYKIQRCERGCTETSLACRYFHDGSGDRRYLELDDDHVGHAIEIPFVARTHDALIKKLKTLGL
jgi:hypothetical protein